MFQVKMDRHSQNILWIQIKDYHSSNQGMRLITLQSLFIDRISLSEYKLQYLEVAPLQRDRALSIIRLNQCNVSLKSLFYKNSSDSEPRNLDYSPVSSIHDKSTL